MAQHLPGKVARLISDFLTIGELTTLIEHEMEKRIVARHGLVKLDALLTLGARLKNDIRDALPPIQKKTVGPLENLIARLRKDLEKSDMATGRDALAAHTLHLDLMRIVDAWKCMGETTYGVLTSDLREIDAELLRLASCYPAALTYPGASTFSVEQGWQTLWRDNTYLGDPNRPSLANIYPGLGTAGNRGATARRTSSPGRDNSGSRHCNVSAAGADYAAGRESRERGRALVRGDCAERLLRAVGVAFRLGREE